MKWFILFVVFILCMIGYMNRNAYRDCISEQTRECEERNEIGCWVKAKEHCEWVKK